MTLGIGREVFRGGSPAPAPRLSTTLAALAAGAAGARVELDSVLRAMGDRAFGAMLFVFALPNVLPTPPGAGILGLPLVVLSLQLATGRLPWLPATIRRRSLDGAWFAGFVGRAVPLLERGERVLRPRLGLLLRPAAERALGWLCLLLSVLLFLPIPFGNMLPALAIAVIALGLLERDGLWILCGAALGAAALLVIGFGLSLLADALRLLAAG